MTMDLKTPLYDCHVALEGRMVPFAGYVLPVQYPTGVIREHMAVRQACGLFDVSHMGEVLYKGPDALANLQKLLTNDFSTMREGKVRYSVMCNPKGGVVDDLIVYRFSQDAYWVVVNAANRHKDVNWMRENLFGDCQLTDMSDDVAQLALQGPKAEAVFAKVCDQEPPAGYYTFIPEMTVAGVKCLVSRTGYTGEDGFELYCANADAPPCGMRCWKRGRTMGSSPAAWALATRCGWRPPCPFTAMRWTIPSARLKPGLAGRSRCIRTTSSARPRWQGMSSPHAAAWGLRSPGAASRASTATCT